MQMKRISKALSFILCIVLIAAMALFTVGCNAAPASSEAPAATSFADGTVLGEGSTVFPLSVVDQDGNITNLEIHTDKTIVGEALLELGVIEGDDGQYGLYVKKVNGIVADYDKDGVYWAFYINDEYGMTGVDMTEITPDTTYSFRVEK